MGVLIWRCFLFAVFTLIAAPIEYHVKWLAPWSRGMAPIGPALARPLVEGALFFYAVIVAMHVFKGLCLVAVVPFMMYLVRGVDVPLDRGWIAFQWYLAAGSFLLSLTVFVYLERLEA
jgi:hypothetical protein